MTNITISQDALDNLLSTIESLNSLVGDANKEVNRLKELKSTPTVVTIKDCIDMMHKLVPKEQQQLEKAIEKSIEEKETTDVIQAIKDWQLETSQQDNPNDLTFTDTTKEERYQIHKYCGSSLRHDTINRATGEIVVGH